MPSIVFKLYKKDPKTGSCKYRQEGSSVSWKCISKMFAGDPPETITVDAEGMQSPGEAEKAATEKKAADKAAAIEKRAADKKARDKKRADDKAAREKVRADKKAEREAAKKAKEDAAAATANSGADVPPAPAQ